MAKHVIDGCTYYDTVAETPLEEMFQSDKKCIVCGKRLTANHKCPNRVEGARQSAQTRANEELYAESEILATDKRTFGGRLEEGFLFYD